MTTTNYKGYKLQFTEHPPTRRSFQHTVAVVKDGAVLIHFTRFTRDDAFTKVRDWIDKQEGTE